MKQTSMYATECFLEFSTPQELTHKVVVQVQHPFNDITLFNTKTYTSNTPHLSRMNIPGVRSRPMDRWRKTKLDLQIKFYKLVYS